jgi:two-component system response regulator ChvI
VLTAATPSRTPDSRTTSSVLLADDDQTFVHEAQTALEADGYTVSVAAPGDEALAELPRLRPDIVVASVGSSDENGFGLLRRLRSVRAGRTVPVILLTSGSDEDVLTGFRLGADDCVRKPVSGAELVARVSSKTVRPPIPANLVSRDLRTGLLAEGTLVDEAQRELERGRRASRPGALGVVQLH